MIKSKLSDKVILDLFRKHEQSLFRGLFKSAVNEGYTIKDVDYSGLLEESFRQMSTGEFAMNVVEGIEERIGMDEVGFECPVEQLVD
jgi:hypothetical protein